MSWSLLAAWFLSIAAVQTGVVSERDLQRWLRDTPPIKEITVSGNEFFTDGDITERMYSRRRSLWGALKGDRRTRVHKESLDRDTLEIKYLYLTNGFLGVRVEESFEIILPDSAARAVVRIDEGRRFRYGAVALNGIYPHEVAGGLVELTRPFKVGEPVNLVAVRQAGFDMKTLLANNGYPYGRVTFLLDSATERCGITFQVEADSLVRIGRISVSGTNAYPQYTASREARIKTGSIYRRRDILDTQRRLVESGYFSTARIAQVQPVPDSLNPDFVLRVNERKPMYATFRTGAGQSQQSDLEWDFSVGFGKRNFFRSRRIDLLAEMKFDIGSGRGLLEHMYRVRYTEPWLFKVRMPLSLAVQYEPGVKDPDEDYRIESWSVSISTTKTFGLEYRADAGLEYESVRIYGVPRDEAEIIRNEQGLSVRRKIWVQFRRDSRDNIFVPSRGSLTDIAVERYGGFLGGDDHFARIDAAWSSYQVIWPGWISATRLKGGWAEAFGPSREVPFDDRFRLGGANTIRGFKVNTLGPLAADGTLERASFYTVFNQEFRWQTIQVLRVIPLLDRLLENIPLWQSVFFDMGNGFRSVREFTPREFAYTYGTGFQLMSPAGPIRVDYARRIKTRHIDFDYTWHFTILYAF